MGPQAVISTGPGTGHGAHRRGAAVAKVSSLSERPLADDAAAMFELGPKDAIAVPASSGQLVCLAEVSARIILPNKLSITVRSSTVKLKNYRRLLGEIL